MKEDTLKETLSGIIVTIILLLPILIGVKIFIQVETNEYNKKIENWKNTKLVVEQSLSDENISDLEKISLVETIIEYNMKLTSLKEDVKQWWHWYLDDDKVNKLKIIEIGEK